jgi:hypothetical protein
MKGEHMRRNAVLRITKAQKQYSQMIGRLGGKVRARNLTAEERRAGAIKASQAAVEARRRKVAERAK